MKAKKIALIISAFLFIFGLLLSGFLTFTDVVREDWKQLLFNVAIGFSSSGMVAMLIEIPMTLSQKAYNYRVLKAHTYHTYLRCEILINLIEAACEYEKTLISEQYCTSSIDELVQFATPLIGLDPHMYINSAKRNQIRLLVETMSNFTMQRKTMELAYQIKINEAKMKALNEVGINYPPLVSKDFKYELEQIKGKVAPMREFINNTLRIVMTERQYQGWIEELKYIHSETERIKGALTASWQKEAK